MVSKLNCKVTRVLYPPATEQKASWFVLLTNMGKASGKMSWRPEQGEALTLNGKWGTYNGERNYQFTFAMPDTPADPRDMLRYVCERTKGVGEAMQIAIWEKYNADWQDEITSGDIKGLTPARFEALQETLSLVTIEAEKSQAIGWLMGLGATVAMATAAWEKWGKETAGVVQNNCYRLADLPNFGFVNVDGQIRESFGIGDSDPRRVSAAIIYRLVQMTASGSTVVDWTALRESACGLVGTCHTELVSKLVSEMFDDGTLKGFSGSESIALGGDFRNEMLIWEWANEAA